MFTYFTIALNVILLVLWLWQHAGKKVTAQELLIAQDKITNLLNSLNNVTKVKSELEKTVAAVSNEAMVQVNGLQNEIEKFRTTVTTLRSRGDTYRDALDTIIGMETPAAAPTVKKIATVAREARSATQN